MLINSSATLNQDMFWHGDSLVTSRVKKDFAESMFVERESNIGQFDYVLGDDRHHRSMDCSFHWKSNSLCFDQAVDSLWLFCVGETWFCWTVDSLSLSLHNASSQSRRRRPLFPPGVAAVLCWFLRRDACSPQFVSLPLLYPGILSSIRSSFHLFLKRVLPLTG